MRFFFLVLFLVRFVTYNVFSQGCVAIRGFSGDMSNIGSSANLQQGEFQFIANSRYFDSYKHFRGSHEETERVEKGTEVINNSYIGDLTFSYGITNRFFTSAVLPYVNFARSSMYEHGGNPPNGLGDRHSTFASGLADVRFSLGYWLLDPNVNMRNNYSVSLGMKLPTGNYDYQGTFYNQGTNKDEAKIGVVDQSIQPGDGGYAMTIDLASYNYVTDDIVVSSNLNYLINPQATNGVKTRNGAMEFSCPDQFAARVGAYYVNPKLYNFAFYFGGRTEGITASDLIGSSEGYRRPGYVISIEPGISYSYQRMNFSFNLPIALYRNRIQSYDDKAKTKATGVFTQGDAAFADYLINFSISYRFGSSNLHNMVD
mgnify:FL=1